MSLLHRLGRTRGLFSSSVPFFPPPNYPAQHNDVMLKTTQHQQPPVRHFSADAFFTSISHSTAVAHFQDGLVRLHDTTGLPWWATIVLSTVLMRTVITLPLTIYQHRITARLEHITAEMPAIVAELKQEAAVARRHYKWSEAETRRVYNRSVKKQWDALVVRENCHPLKTFCVVWGQIPLWIVQSMALRNLLTLQPDASVLQAQLAFTELTLGGCAWFPNLTEVDASLVLPVALGVLNLIIIEIQSMTRNNKREPGKLQIYATNFFRAFSVAMIPIAAGVPAALCLYWTTSSAFGLGQNLLLLTPRLRRFVGISKTGSELEQPFEHLQRQLAGRWTTVQSKFGGKIGG